MTFVNEYITDQDRQKYGLDARDQELRRRAHAPSRSWTIDHERDIYFRQTNSGREEFGNHSTWDFYWHGEPLVVELAILQAGGQPGAPCWANKKILEFQLPPYLEPRRDEIITDLREALTAYKDGGVFAKSTTYTLTLDV